MDKVSITLKIFFEDPFWIGLFESILDDQLSVCKVTFFSEPSDQEIYEWIIRKYSLLKFSPKVKTVVKKMSDNPKRRQREAKKLSHQLKIGTKSQQALKLQHEQLVSEKKELKKRNEKQQKEFQYQLKKEKHKAKHRGR